MYLLPNSFSIFNGYLPNGTSWNRDFGLMNPEFTAIQDGHATAGSSEHDHTGENKQRRRHHRRIS